jgi:hypothetical protein
MSALRRLILLLLVAVCAALQAAEPAKPPPRALDLSKLPPGTIFIIGEEGKDALQQPGVVVLSPEKFKDLLDQIDQLKKQAGPDKPDTPSSCKLTGQVDGDLIRLKAVFEFQTRKRKSLVTLGCQKAWPTAAVLDDGKLPILPPPGDDGFVVQIEQPGPHRLTLDLEVPVASVDAKGTDRGFKMGLPRAAITVVEALDVPDNVKDVRFVTRQLPAKDAATKTEPDAGPALVTRQFAARDLSSRNGQRKLIALGPVDRLEVSWKGPTPQRPADPILTVQGQIVVRVEESNIRTDAELTLKPDIGQVNQWQIQASPTVDLKVEGPADDRAPVVTPPPADAKGVPVWTIKLREPSSAPITVRIVARQPRGARFGVGPFAVPQAMRQHGLITVSVPPDLRPRFKTRGEVSQREVAEGHQRGDNTVAVFAYWNLPPAPAANQPVPPALDVELETIKGAIETTVNHTLRLVDQTWQVSSEIDVSPVRAVVEHLDVELPPGYEVRASPAILVEPDLEVKDGPKRIGSIKLAQKQTRPFKIVLDGTWPLVQGQQALTVPLLKPVPTVDKIQLIDKGGRVTVSIPEGLELVTARESGAETLPPGRREQSWRADRAPTRVELGWQKHRPELTVDGQVDVTLTDRQGVVRQRLRFQPAQDPNRELELRAPDFPPNRTPGAGNAKLTRRAGQSWGVRLTEPTLTLDYAFDLPAANAKGGARRAVVPLFWPAAATRGSMRVRVWSDGQPQVVRAVGPWDEQPTEVVAERDSLPALVLRGSGMPGPSGPEFPLTLDLSAPAHPTLATLTVEKALIQAQVLEAGQQSYRARFLLNKVAARALDVELPAPPASLNLEAWLDGQVLRFKTVDASGMEDEAGHVARLRIVSDPHRRWRVLELRYHVPAGLVAGSGSLETAFQPPRLQGNFWLGRVLWQVALPGDRVPVLVRGGAGIEQRWALRGGLPAPRPSWTAAELEHWFSNHEDLRTTFEPPPEFCTRRPDLVCAQASLGTLPVVHLSQQAWLLSCSLVVLAVGLGLYFAPVPRRIFWGVLAGIGLALVVLSIGWTDLVPVLVYGCLPGVAVLLLLIGVQWIVQRRYRRAVVFMPAFSRITPGSSVMRTGSSQRRREPSTVDAPPGALGAELGSGSLRLQGRPPE